VIKVTVFFKIQCNNNKIVSRVLIQYQRTEIKSKMMFRTKIKAKSKRKKNSSFVVANVNRINILKNGAIRRKNSWKAELLD